MLLVLKVGLAWFASDMAPYLYSIFTFNPDISAITASHWLVQTHIVIGFLIILLVPFSRLVHFLVAPFHYITRPYQIASDGTGIQKLLEMQREDGLI